MFKALSVLVVVLMMTLSSTSQTTVPKSAGDHFNAGGALLRAGKPTEALVEFRESVRLDPAQPGAHAVIGSVLMLIGKPADAILSFREAIRLAPADGRFRTSICKAYILTRSFDEAVAACE
jgi:Tfp pilus assembly protein PilF